MRLVHIRPYGFEVGSVYKYGEMISRVVETVDAICPIRDNARNVALALEKNRADIALVRGDIWEAWKGARMARVPYILDEHDIGTLRVPDPSVYREEERQMIEGAAAIIFTSEDHQAYCQEHYACPPSRVVHLRPLAEALDFKPLPKLRGKHIVYAGGLIPASGATNIYGYRSYGVSIFPELLRAGWTVHVYPCYLAGDVTKNEFRDLGCVVHDEVPERDLPRELSQYGVSLQAYANDGCVPEAFEYCMTCRPNKLWTGLSAGIPTVGFQGGNGTKLYDGRWGLVANSLRDLPKVAERALSMKIPESLRRSETLDRDEHLFRELVEIAEKAPKPGPIVTYALGVEVDFEGRTWPIGSPVTHDTALRMKAAGVIAGNGMAR